MNEQNNPAISFVIPAYNCAETLEESMNSIFSTNFQSGDEVIIVNDCSNDNTQTIIFGLQQKYPEIKIIKNEKNLGCPATRNVGIRIAKNPLIFNLDSDDVLEKNSVEKLKDFLISNNADLAAFGEIHFFTNSTKKITHKWICKNGVMTLANYLSGQIIPGGNYLYTKASWQKIGGYWEYGKGLHEFWGFTFKQLANGSKMVVMPNSYYFHRYSHRSLYMRESKKTNESIEVSNKFIEPFLYLFDDKTRKYISGNPNWFENLGEKPLYPKDGSIGKTGKLVYTSRIKNILLPIRKFFN